MAQATRNRIRNTVLLLIWVTMALLELTTPVKSQDCLPPFVTPGYLNPNAIRKMAWRQFLGNVTVKIEGSFSVFVFDATTRIEDGHRKWNNPLICSGVNFGDFQNVSFTPQDLLSDAPAGEVHWEIDMPSNGFNAEVIGHLDELDQVASATIKVRPELVVPNPVYFNYLGSHEIGYSHRR